MNWLNNTSSQPSKFTTENSVEINDGSYGTYSTKFKTSVISSSLCDYSDVYILVKGTITYNKKTKL